MSPHWTYEDFNAGEDLAQGDIIQPNSDVRDVLALAHAHFLDPKYTAFIILSQSCDIARRDNGACKSRYINLAVIRPLEDVLLSFLNTECTQVKIGKKTIDGLFFDGQRYRAEQLLSRILNQNEHGLGLFYLHEDIDVGIAVSSVAMLQVSIALRSDHYNQLIAARSGRLKPDFRSRLGWIIGNLYSRVATRDWDPSERKKIIGDILSANEQGGKSPAWVPRENVTSIKSKAPEIEALEDLPSILEAINRHKPDPPMEIAIERVLNVCKEAASIVAPEALEAISIRLKNDQFFKSTFSGN